MGFPSAPKLVILNDHEPRNGRYLRYFIEFGLFGANYVTVVVEIKSKDPYCLRQICGLKNPVFGNIYYRAYYNSTILRMIA